MKNLMSTTLLFLVIPISSNQISATASTVQIDDNIRFWAPQLSEHADMAADFINSSELKKRASHLSKQLKQFNKATLTQKDRKEFIEYCDKMKIFQNNVRTDVKKSKAKKEKKELDLALLAHMDKETDYARKKAEGKQFSKREEVEFWSEEHADEAHVMEILMNPNASKLKKEAHVLEKKLKSNAHLCADSLTVIEQAHNELDQLADRLDKNPSLTHISTRLAKHEKRERQRAAQTFKLLELED